MTLANIQTIYDENDDVVFEKIATAIATELNKLSAKQELVTFAVCGGRSVAQIFIHLRHENIDWKKIHFFMVDERMVPIDNEDANYMIVQEHLIEPLMQEGQIEEEQVHPFEYAPDDNDNGLDNYTELLRDFKSNFDVILLSSGEDGHVAALYPNHHSIRDGSQFFLQMDDSPKEPPHRMTASRKLLLAADVGFLLIMGEGKKSAFGNFVNDDVALEQCPAKIVHYLPKAYVGTNLRL